MRALVSDEKGFFYMFYVRGHDRGYSFEEVLWCAMVSRKGTDTYIHCIHSLGVLELSNESNKLKAHEHIWEEKSSGWYGNQFQGGTGCLIQFLCV